MTELPKTEQELNDLIAAKVKEAVDPLVSKHNGEMASLRQKHADEIKKVKDQAGLTAEQLAEEKVKEQQAAEHAELEELRAFKKTSIISEKLAKEGLPTYFKNDNRLLNAEEGTLDKVIKDVKKDYEANLPKGATHSTVVNVSNGQKGKTNQNVSAEDQQKQEAYNEMGEALKGMIS